MADTVSPAESANARTTPSALGRSALAAAWPARDKDITTTVNCLARVTAKSPHRMSPSPGADSAGSRVLQADRI